jgi:hypothetical protein
MRTALIWWLLLLAAACGGSSGSWVADARVLVPGVGVQNQDCRADICQHNENTDLISWKGAVWLVHRTALSQVLGPNSALHVYRSADGGRSFEHRARILAPTDRDLRDPHFFLVGDTLHIKALTRLPVTSTRDSNVDTIAVLTTSDDGSTWTDLQPIGPPGFSFWRIAKGPDALYTAAYADGDKSVTLFRSTDGAQWTRGALVYGVAADTPLETELVFVPSSGGAAPKMLALVRTDGDDLELLGTQGRLRTKVCLADAPPYEQFDCSAELDGQRLDGPAALWWNGRLFVVARKHLGVSGRKRTALFELPLGTDGRPTTIIDRGELPSAGDTAYAGVAPLGGARFAVTWYSSDIRLDPDWVTGMLGATDIWSATLDLSALSPAPTR